MNNDLWIRAQKSVAQGALTNSKHPKMLIMGAYPTHISHGSGSYLFDHEGNKYTDYICGLGANFLGYGNDLISRELIKQIYGGFSHSLPTHHEVECAEKLKEFFVFTERWKFLKSGSEACNAALKIARCATGRYKVLSHGYHGIGDDFISLTPPAHGVPSRNFIRELRAIDDITTDIAAVIIEPVITDYGSERIEYLKELRKKCTDTGTMLIFDEVITGFRFSKFGVCNYTGIIPDLIVIGKAMANGLPLAAVGGKAEVMDDPRYFVSSTYAGEVLSLVACKSVLNQLQKNSEYSVDKLWVHGQEFINQFNEQPGDIKIEGYPTRGVFTGDQENQAIFMGAMAKAYVLFCKSFFYNFGHPAQDKDILSLTVEIKERIVNKVLKLEYPLPESPFSMKVRQNG